jgi:glyoxylase-like metal-dependent hydrolase (beta-lactamase superfamily II)
MVLKHVAALTEKPVVAVFDTHIHGDHWLGNQAIKEKYPDVKIYAHPNVFKEISSGEGDSWVTLMETLTEGASKGTRVVGPDTEINHGDVITVGDIEFRIHHYGVAHTHSDIMIELPAKKLIFLGDNALIGRIGRIDHFGNVKGNIEALGKAIEMDNQYYIPGHGPSDGKEVAQSYLDFLSILYEEVGRHYEDGLSDFEMKPQVVAKLGNWSKWISFDEQVGKIINTAYMEIEEASF